MQCFSSQMVEQSKVEIHYHVYKNFCGDVVLQVKSVKSFFAVKSFLATNC